MEWYACDHFVSLFINNFQLKNREVNSELLDHCDENKISDQFEAGEFLFKNGTPVYGVFYIRSGLIELIYKTSDGFFVKEIKSPGEIIGIENLEDDYFTYDALVLEEAEVYFFDRNFCQSELLATT